jgi:peptidoglycan-associated lipoprotein
MYTRHTAYSGGNMLKCKIGLIAAVIISAMLLPGCRKNSSNIQDTHNAAQEKKELEQQKDPFANVDTSSNADFREAALSEELARKAREALQTIYFEYNSYQLTSAAIDRIMIINSFLKENAGLRILIAGHCDERGSSDYNMGLAEQRARAVKEYLINLGIQPIRIETTSFGKEQPAVAGCHDDDCHLKNRRDEFTVLAR